ncbi:glutamate ABC transporter substrate-binding protein [Phytoactinopolyspora halotolerans]|uniref:Glutamate ABC transporter substrate-binding protein n=1 Tax=Phytoactinopolyspora halotolerans TaxID=1981512 RepID=A0A6L9SB52_9ACTN|nr:glutamate ABC transporter substrate-binding protein [Phytoactinopolyspora halotolerans]NEE01738.1 glutamate ABC transporter substrate-binding protein [Phytoactinopolyspora halotolerans]
MRTKRFIFAAVAASTALALAACGDDDDDTTTEPEDVEAGDFEEGTTMAELADAGSITIGTKFDQPLFGLRGPSGDPEGFDVEIGKIIASKLGIDEDGIEWVETQSANREPYIEDGRVDIVVATYTINDERKEVVDFAGPYYEAGQMIMVRADEEEIESPDDLAGKSVCTVEGSTPAQNMRDNYPDANLELFGAYSDCLEPLRQGQVDALTTDNVILAGYVSESPDDFKLVGEQFTEEPYGIGLAKGDDEFRDFINDVLEESYDDGSWVEAWESTAGEVLETPEPPEVDRY